MGNFNGKKIFGLTLRMTQLIMLIERRMDPALAERSQAMFRRSGNGRGFTLVELMVVMSILAIMSSLVVVMLGSAQKKARTLECANNLRVVGIAIINYAHHKGGGFLPNFTFGMEEYRVADQWVWELDFISEEDRYLSRQVGFNSTVQDSILPPRMAPEVLRCKADVQLYVNGQSILTSYWMHPANTCVPYSSISDRPETPFGFEADAFNETANCGCRFHTQVPPIELDTSHFGGGHILFADGSVQLYTDKARRQISYWQNLVKEINTCWANYVVLHP